MADSRYKEKIRDGEKVKELDCPPNFKSLDGKCVKMSAKEMKNRSRAAHKTKRVQGNQQKYIDKKRNDTIEKNEDINMNNKIRQIIREEIKSILNESDLKKDIKKQEVETKYFLSYLEGMLHEIDSPNEKLFYSAMKGIDLAFRQLNNVFKDYK